MNSSFPVLLLLSDGVFSEKHFGFNKTLYNIFASYPADRLRFLSPYGCKTYVDDIAPQHVKHLTYYKEKIIKEIRNRIGLLMNRFFDVFNFSVAYSPSYYSKDILSSTEAEIVVVCPNTVYNMVAATALLKHKTPNQKVFVFLMDDILAHNNQRFWGGSVHESAKELFAAADGCFFISDALAQQVFKEYDIPAKKYKVLHNPINIHNILSDSPLRPKLNEVSLAYAGSIFEMHLDAILALIKAIDNMDTYKVSLTIYTQPPFFDSIKQNTSSSSVVYGGLLSQKELYGTLNKHDFLVCASAFNEQSKKVISTSVFTKITDYMVANRPVIGVGPSYAANNAFILKHDIGFTTSQQETEALAKELESIFRDDTQYQHFIEKYPIFLKQHYDQENIMKQLVQFVKEA